mmetsp:Transcript_114967/g.320283  ORF Transcript_114967/g.320283 Transcript_114967/m.320283 type:complete len:238 (+) Transcript_114967:859-1572(+)
MAVGIPTGTPDILHACHRILLALLVSQRDAVEIAPLVRERVEVHGDALAVAVASCSAGVRTRLAECCLYALVPKIRPEPPMTEGVPAGTGGPQARHREALVFDLPDRAAVEVAPPVSERVVVHGHAVPVAAASCGAGVCALFAERYGGLVPEIRPIPLVAVEVAGRTPLRGLQTCHGAVRVLLLPQWATVEVAPAIGGWVVVQGEAIFIAGASRCALLCARFAQPLDGLVPVVRPVP